MIDIFQDSIYDQSPPVYVSESTNCLLALSLLTLTLYIVLTASLSRAIVNYNS